MPIPKTTDHTRCKEGSVQARHFIQRLVTPSLHHFFAAKCSSQHNLLLNPQNDIRYKKGVDLEISGITKNVEDFFLMVS